MLRFFRYFQKIIGFCKKVDNFWVFQNISKISQHFCSSQEISILFRFFCLDSQNFSQKTQKYYTNNSRFLQNSIIFGNIFKISTFFWESKKISTFLQNSIIFWKYLKNLNIFLKISKIRNIFCVFYWVKKITLEIRFVGSPLGF